ncbi:uncharacterized protein B4U79_07609 [Dinothrombium tinctorium]|uniref:CD80-like immunoglobulin C2-set domain-containing protein n=1 Tax=Dinothrombium tinctorium TaxID=1965070 RepID=A0A443RAM2_9ACAR|nr:uncharacterized protein B4U79_07609 [Dinothrombium tinctorium]
MKEKTNSFLDLPESGPTLLNKEANYNIDDLVNVTCKTGESKPMVTLHWFINGEKIYNDHVYTINSRSEFSHTFQDKSLQKSISQLHFRVKEWHFVTGQMTIRCDAFILQNYTTSSEQFIVYDQSKSTFYTVQEGNGPVITGTKATYKLSDYINVTCTSSKSKPASDLSWFINDKLVNDGESVKNFPKVQFSDGNEIARMALSFRLSSYFDSTPSSSYLSSSSSPSKSTQSKRLTAKLRENRHIRLKCESRTLKKFNIGSIEAVFGNNQKLSSLQAEENKAVASDTCKLMPLVK